VTTLAPPPPRRAPRRTGRAHGPGPTRKGGRRRRPLPRPPAYVGVVGTVAVLNVIGLVMVLSASSVAALSSYGSSWYVFNRQLMWAALGGVAFMVTARVDYRRWRRAGLPLMIVACGLLVAVLVPGVGIKVDGSSRWLGAGFVRFQPAEVAKLAVLVFVADRLTSRARDVDDWRSVLAPLLGALGAVAVLVLLEPDLATTIVIGGIAMTLFAVGGIRMRHLAAVGGVAVAACAYLSLAEPYRRRRVESLWHPFDEAVRASTGYQLSQSLIAIGSGGWDGVGLGNGKAKWLYLPNSHTDFIFAIIGEELGLIGCLLVLALFAAFAVLGLRVALRAPDRFGMLIAAGVTAWIVGQAAINVAAVIGLVPVSGIPLPFLSAGGSALVFAMAGAGILANVARHSRPSRPRAAAPARPAR
jgi:cell division protein FtsW